MHNTSSALEDCDQVKKFLKYFFIALKVSFFAFFLFIVSLFFRSQELPPFLVGKIVDRISSDSFYIKCDGASFGFRHGITLSHVSVHDIKNDDLLKKPLVSADFIHLNFFTRTIRIVSPSYQRLPMEYYSEVNENAEDSLGAASNLDLPDVADFGIVFEFPDILGLKLDSVSANVCVSGRKLLVNDITIDLPSREGRTTLRGDFSLDFNSMKIWAQVSGHAKQSQIRPFLEVLDIQCSLPYVDAFTELPSPVPSKLEVDADLITGDLVLWMHYSPKMGKYRAVPMDFADGDVFFYTRKGEEKRRVALKVDLSNAIDREGRILKGFLTVDDFSGKFRLNYDVFSSLKFEDALVISEVLDPADFSFIKCIDAPQITLKGTSGVSADDMDATDLGGSVKLSRGEFLGLKFKNLEGTYSLKRDVFSMKGAMNGKDSGKIDFETDVFLEGYEIEKMHFSMKGRYRNGALSELAELFSFDLGERKGNVECDIELRGRAGGEKPTASYCGKGRFSIRDGRLARMKLFAGLTEILADKVPGVSFLVDQTQASADFTIKDGVISSENIFIEGGLISIKAWGSYDISEDNLNLTARVQILKEEDLMSKIIHPITYPVTKLFLEFKATGPIDDPKWDNITLLDRTGKGLKEMGERILTL